MHRNTFINAPQLLDRTLRLKPGGCFGPVPLPGVPIFVAGQLSGTEGYCEAIMSGLVAALAAYALVSGREMPELPQEMAFGALLAYATDPQTRDYQPMHVNFGLLPGLDVPVRDKKERYRAFAQRGEAATDRLVVRLILSGLMRDGRR